MGVLFTGTEPPLQGEMVGEYRLREGADGPVLRGIGF